MLKLLQKISLKSLLKYSIASVILVIPLYPKFPILTVPGTYVAIRAEDFLVTFLALVFVLYFVKTNKKLFFKDKLHQAIFLFITVGLISVLSGVFLTQTVSLQIGLLHWARRIE